MDIHQRGFQAPLMYPRNFLCYQTTVFTEKKLLRSAQASADFLPFTVVLVSNLVLSVGVQLQMHTMYPQLHTIFTLTFLIGSCSFFLKRFPTLMYLLSFWILVSFKTPASPIKTRQAEDDKQLTFLRFWCIIQVYQTSKHTKREKKSCESHRRKYPCSIPTTLCSPPWRNPSRR